MVKGTALVTYLMEVEDQKEEYQIHILKTAEINLQINHLKTVSGTVEEQAHSEDQIETNPQEIKAIIVIIPSQRSQIQAVIDCILQVEE